MAWFWMCTYDNGASDWKDSDGCRACSKKKYKTEEEAKKAGLQHEYRTGHSVLARKIHGNKRW